MEGRINHAVANRIMGIDDSGYNHPAAIFDPYAKGVSVSFILESAV